MTGGLLIQNGGTAGTIDPGLLLEFIGTASGRTLRAQDSLASSGTLVVRAGVTFQNTVSCAFLQSSSLGSLSCGTTLGLTFGGTNKNFTAVNGGIICTDADSLEVSAAGSTGMTLVSQGTAAPLYKRERVYERFPLFGPQANAVPGSGATLVTAFSGSLVAAQLQTSGFSSGVTVSVWINSKRAFSTPLSTDNREPSSVTAATPVIINGTNARFNRYQDLRIGVSKHVAGDGYNVSCYTFI
ncbi:hypothetical protein [Zavarzinella formosa]|uniref:hypothetical protein n=1 Tax=Zavarzinella formosa TaxID=360055 RepID=UPI000374F156|nr:hypothetical protein [Zavarzinella formosa]